MEHKKNKNIQIKNKNYNEIATFYNEYYIKDIIINNTLLTKFKMNYKYTFVSISKNGGLIAICK